MALSSTTVVAAAGLAVTVLGSVVGATRHITRLGSSLREQKLESEREAAEQRHHDLEAKYEQMVNLLAASRRSGTAALARKMDIDDELLTVMKVMQASAASVYVPIRAGPLDSPRGLMFLSMQPFDERAARLSKKTIPMDSYAGICLSTGKPSVRLTDREASGHYRKADLVSGFRTRDALNLPLRHQGRSVGVLQLLNKEGSARFVSEDISRAERLSSSLAEKVHEFISERANLEVLGMGLETRSSIGTIAFYDLSRSSSLFRELSAESAIQHINEYLEVVSDVALRHGATIDKYMGDGVLLRFNVPRPIRDPEMAAVEAAYEAVQEFQRLKESWLTLGEPLDDVFLRIGIASGPVHEAVVGHPQYQSLTVMGRPVGLAVNLTDVGSRDKNVALMDEETQRRIGSKFHSIPLAGDLGKAGLVESRGFQLEDLPR